MNYKRIVVITFVVSVFLFIQNSPHYGSQFGQSSTAFAYPIGIDCGPANDGAYWWDEQELRWYQCKYDFQLQGWYWIQATDPPVVRDTGTPRAVLASNFPRTLQHVRIENGRPGLKNLRVEVNGQAFQVAGLRDGEQRIIDISSALLSTPNEVRLIGLGKPGGTAAVFIER